MIPRLAFLLAAVIHLPMPAAVVVAYDSRIEAYRAALNGFRAAIGTSPLTAIDLAAAGAADELTSAVSARDTHAVVAVGSTAWKEVQLRKPLSPVIAAMVLHSAEADGAGIHIDLDVSLPTQLETMRALMPQSSRAGVILNPKYHLSAEVLQARARKEGYALVVVECADPTHLLKALASFKGRVDFVLCFPDSEFYNPVTIKPLVLASLQDRIPLVGFSPAFVRAGAAADIYPDYEQTGRQAAELALRILKTGDRTADEGPAKVDVAINQRVARLLGIEFRSVPFRLEVFR